MVLPLVDGAFSSPDQRRATKQTSNVALLLLLCGTPFDIEEGEEVAKEEAWVDRRLKRWGVGVRGHQETRS